MKISAINTIKYLNFPNKMNVTQTFKQSCDTFVKEAKNEEKELPKSIKRTRKFDILEYKILPSKEKAKIRESIPKKIKTAAEETIFIGNYVKDYLDKTYGKDKYIFACIGTSPSGLGRFMEFSGVETKYFPITKFGGDAYFTRKSMDMNKKGVEKYVSFIHKQGLSSKKLRKSDKTILFVDYAETGNTLKNFKILLQEGANIYSDKLKFEDIDFLLDEATKDLLSKDETTKKMHYRNIFVVMGGNEQICGIPHLRITDFEDMDRIIKHHSLDDAKLFNFCIIDELNKQGKLIENPLNKNCL